MPLAVLMSAAALLSCAGIPPSFAAPTWVLRTETDYPRAKYIAQTGRGADRQKAELAALSRIAYFMLSEISTRQGMRSIWAAGADGQTAAKTETEEAISVESQVRLTAVRYAEEPYFDKGTKEYVSLAYIDRDEGWQSYERNAQNQIGAFLELVRAAEANSDPMGRALRFGAADRFSKGDVFTGVWDFALVLNPAKAAAAYLETGNAIAALPEKIYTARQKASVFIDCSADYNGYLYQAAVSAFGNAGFPVEARRDRAAAVCVIRVDEGFQQMDSGVLYYPSLSVNLSGKTASLFSFNISVPRQAAITADAGRRRSYDALAKMLVEKFPLEITKNPSMEK